MPISRTPFRLKLGSARQPGRDYGRLPRPRTPWAYNGPPGVRTWDKN